MNICTYERGHPYTAEGIDGPFVFITYAPRTGISRIEYLATGEQVSLKLPEFGDPWMHPQPERLRDMAMAFGAKAKNRYNVVDFGRSISGVEPWSGCGTVACHGGWAGLIPGAGQHYLDGAKELGTFLCPWWGHEEGDDFPFWADNHPSLWGNECGLTMFLCDGHTAFGFDDEDECALKDIANHYREVANRIEALL
jgi:hypothetical protein